MSDRLPQGEVLCGEGVQYAITPGWVAELSLEELPAGPYRLYTLYCGHANSFDGDVWLRNPRKTARQVLGCSERTVFDWHRVLENLGLITAKGRFAIRVHRRQDDIAEAQEQNAMLSKHRRRRATSKRKRHARAGPRKIEEEVLPLLRWGDANRQHSAGQPAAQCRSDTVDKLSQPAAQCRSDDANRQHSAGQPAAQCRHLQKSEIKNSDSCRQAKNGSGNDVPPTDEEEATNLAQQHDVDLDLAKEALMLVHQVRTRLSSSVVVDIELAAKRKHAPPGEDYLRAVVDGYRDRLADLDEREGIQAEAKGELIVDDTTIDGEAIPF